MATNIPEKHDMIDPGKVSQFVIFDPWSVSWQERSLIFQASDIIVPFSLPGTLFSDQSLKSKLVLRDESRTALHNTNVENSKHIKLAILYFSQWSSKDYLRQENWQVSDSGSDSFRNRCNKLSQYLVCITSRQFRLCYMKNQAGCNVSSNYLW